MTLRVIIEVVPFGAEEDKYEIGRIDIHNGAHAGFGQSVYYGTYKSDDQENSCDLQNIFHSRKDGALVLIKKVIEEIENIHS